MIAEGEQMLVSQCLRGNRLACKTLYDKYSDAMYNVAYRMMGSRDEAADVLQDAFLEIFRKLESFRGESTLGAWIKRIVINHCLNQLKKRKIDFLSLEEGVLNIPDTYQDDSDVQLSVDKVKRGIEKLPDGYKQVLTLYLIEGYDHTEIAQILGIQETGSKSQYSRARVKLRQILETQTL